MVVRRSNHAFGGFTLVEVLVSCLILAVGAVVVCQLANRCLNNTAYGVQYGQACRLLDEVLNKALSGRLGELAALESVEGRFEPYYPDYTYRIELQRTEYNDLYEVKAQVSWRDGSRQYRVETQTLLYDLERVNP